MGNLFWNDSSCKTQKRFDFENTIWTTKILLISVGVVASLVLFRIIIIPYASIFLISTLPCFWDSLKVLFSPPYIYIIVNFIILIIAASSTLQHPDQNHPTKDGKKTTITNDLHRPVLDANPADDTQFDPVSVYQDKTHDHVYHVEANNGNQLGEVWQEKDEAEKSVAVTPMEKDREVLKSLKEEASPEDVSLDTFRMFLRKNESNEAENKRIVEERPELDLLGNSNSSVSIEPDDTLDSIWRAITEGQGKPHLTKSDTWNGRQKLARAEPETAVDDDPVAWARRELRKSDTFNENNNNNTVLSTPRREKVVMSQDELNQRADAFIKKFTNDMRLQREQSNQRYLEMVNHGLH